MKDIYDEWLSPRPLKFGAMVPPNLLPRAEDVASVRYQDQNQFLELWPGQHQNRPSKSKQ